MADGIGSFSRRVNGAILSEYPYATNIYGVSQLTSPSVVLRLPTSMVAPRSSARGLDDSSQRKYPKPASIAAMSKYGAIL